MSEEKSRSCATCHAADTVGINIDKFVCWCWYYHAMVLHCETENHEKHGGCLGFNKPYSKLKA
jgi:uncharacterized Fe-S cluster-containing radical SAM superfamily protein